MNTGISTNDDINIMNSMQTAPVPESLSDVEKDTLGEIGNICMGSSATTLSMLLGKRVVITTPKVSLTRGTEYMKDYERPVVATQVSYTEGLTGHNVFVLKKEDAVLITGLLMGGGQSEEEIEEMYISAMSEVMNQMVGGSSTALADILHMQINISPPDTREYSMDDEVVQTMFHDEVYILVTFKMEIEDLLTSNIMQIMPFEFGKRLTASLLGETPENLPEESKSIEAPVMPSNDMNTAMPKEENIPVPEMRPQNSSTANTEGSKTVELKSAKFQSFGNISDSQLERMQQQNIDLISDVPLQVTVVLGKSRKSIKEILEMGMGSIIVLDRLAGEMVDVLVNGKIFARGEVVVIDDNYGVRITEIMPGQMKM